MLQEIFTWLTSYPNPKFCSLQVLTQGQRHRYVRLRLPGSQWCVCGRFDKIGDQSSDDERFVLRQKVPGVLDLLQASSRHCGREPDAVANRLKHILGAPHDQGGIVEFLDLVRARGELLRSQSSSSPQISKPTVDPSEWTFVGLDQFRSDSAFVDHASRKALAKALPKVEIRGAQDAVPDRLLEPCNPRLWKGIVGDSVDEYETLSCIGIICTHQLGNTTADVVADNGTAIPIELAQHRRRKLGLRRDAEIGAGRLVRIPIAEQVDGYDLQAILDERRDDVAPEIAPGRDTVDQNDRRTATKSMVSDPLPTNTDVARRADAVTQAHGK